jgi:SOS-response transcriptional repressor LexA
MPTIQKTLKILEFIRSYQAEHLKAPPMRVIGEQFGMTSTASVQHHIDTMKRRGWIKRKHYDRTIQVIKEERKAA